MPRERENSIVRAILKYLNTLPQARARKVHGDIYNPGEPDIDAVIAGRAVKLEVKAADNTPTPIQVLTLKKWAAAGAVTGVVRSIEETQYLLRQANVI